MFLFMVADPVIPDHELFYLTVFIQLNDSLSLRY